MTASGLPETAKALVAGDKGLLAMDESTPTCNERFAKLGIPQTADARRTFQYPALEIWRGEVSRVAAAQAALIHRARCDRAARRGEYDPEHDGARDRGSDDPDAPGAVLAE